MNIWINDIKIEAFEGETILEAAKRNNINIPTLCHYPELHINSDCRVCVVEVDDAWALKTSCSTPVRDGMKIRTNTPRVLNARKTIVELLLANHDANCTSCTRNLNCELQQLASDVGIDESRFESVLQKVKLDENNPSLVRNPNRCIKCGRCVDVCANVQGKHVLERIGRGHEMEIRPAFSQHIDTLTCTLCGQCANVCPVGAILEKDNTDLVWEKLNDPDIFVMVQVAPAVRVTVGEAFGCEGDMMQVGKLITALKKMGFNHVYDTNFTADLTILEEGTELLKRIENGDPLPMFSSCCPGWINMAEQDYPEILPHISTCKSPQQMFGALAKSYFAEKMNMDPSKIYVVSIMPCTAKKYEAQRVEMMLDKEHPDVDVVLTTRELIKMLHQMGIDFNQMEETKFDDPFGITTGAAAIFGTSGGVAEAALRTLYEVVNKEPLPNIDFKDVRGLQGIKETEAKLGDKVVKVAVAHTLSNAKVLVEQAIKGESPYTFIEIMACPGGCIGGGGQPYGTTNEVRMKRMESLYLIDGAMVYRKSHDNPNIAKLYEEYLSKPNSEKSHHLLHTHYHCRNM
jgi:NADH-quinone oxidoreductase subunit G/NADP-reducing hydrogenase subunit HndD